MCPKCEHKTSQTRTNSCARAISPTDNLDLGLSQTPHMNKNDIDLSLLFNTVKTLASSIQTHHEDIQLIKPILLSIQSMQMDIISLKAAVSSISSAQQSPPLPHVQKLIRDEILEQKEREKRVNSIIIRGLGDDSAIIQSGFNELV